MILQSHLLSGKRYVMGMKQHSRASEETVASARLLRKVMQPVMPMALCRDEAALGTMGVTSAVAASLWDIQYNLTLDPRIRAQLQIDSGGRLTSTQQARRGATEKAFIEISYYKLSALMSTPFERTFFVDNDIFVLEPSLPHDLLTRTARLCDLAMPIVPIRQGLWGSPPAPNLCTCMIYYRNRPEVIDLFLGAALRLARAVHPHVQQRDQEMIWFEWVEARPQLRLLILPEEYYCPSTATKKIDGQYIWNIDFKVAKGRKSKITGEPTTPVPCKSVHGHSSRYHGLWREFERSRAANQSSVTRGAG